MSLDAEVLILGGGCAGLSLAVALAERGFKSVHTLEQRGQYTRDRTWCFWNAERHPFEAAVTHQWDQWKVCLRGEQALQRSAAYRYVHLPADRFYQLAQQALDRSGQRLSLGVHVHGVRQRGEGCEVETDRGVLRARWVFDARPLLAPEAAAPVVQRFVGWHVRTAHPCFHPATVELMDFQPTPQRGRTAFFYILPFSPTEALVEATYLDDPALPLADATHAIENWLLARASGPYEILYREAGTLPMGAPARRTPGKGRVVEIGIRGGRLKASSGYAFLRIQRQSRALAQALAAGASLPRSFESGVFSVLDSIFLKAMRLFPERTPDYFMALFRRVPADRLVRFLSETASPAEILDVMLALPKLDFLHAALALRERTLS